MLDVGYCYRCLVCLSVFDTSETCKNGLAIQELCINMGYIWMLPVECDLMIYECLVAW